MRILLLLIMLMIIPPSATRAETSNIEHDIIVGVKGMVCDFCAQSVKKVFGKQESVQGVAIDFNAAQIIIDVKEGQTLNDEKIKELITWSGYETVNIIR